MHAYGSKDLRVRLGQFDSRLAGLQINPWNQNALHARRPCPAQDLGEISFEIAKIQMAVRVYESHVSGLK